MRTSLSAIRRLKNYEEYELNNIEINKVRKEISSSIIHPDFGKLTAMINPSGVEIVRVIRRGKKDMPITILVSWEDIIDNMTVEINRIDFELRNLVESENENETK